MAHKSRLAVIVIDCRSDDLDREARFWTGALGRENEREPIDPRYRDLKGPASEPRVLLQKVDHDPRVHLDMETDDIPAEVERLKALGATVAGECKGWVVMEAPSGHRFCVVPPQRPDFDEKANVWS